MTDDDLLPGTARRAVEQLRRLEPPPDLVRAVVRAAEVTPQRRGWSIAGGRLVGAGAVAALVIVAILLGPRLPGFDLGAGGSSVVPSGSIDLRVPVPDGAYPSSADAGSIWLAHEATGRVLRLDASTGALLGEVQVNAPTSDLYSLAPTSDGTSVWASGRDDRSVVRIDIATMRIVSRWPIDAVPYRIVPAAESLWISDFDRGRVLQVDAADGRILATYDVRSPTGIAVTPAAIFVAGFVGDLVVIDPGTRAVVAEHRVDGRATDLAVVDGDLLVWGINGRQLERFDLDTSTVVARRPGVTGVALLDGGVWAALRRGAIERLDAALEPQVTIELGAGGTDQLVAAADRLWAYLETPSGTFAYAIRARP